MNLDRFNHFTSYFNRELDFSKPRPPQDLVMGPQDLASGRSGSFTLANGNIDSGMSDWGIEETLSNPSLAFKQPHYMSNVAQETSSFGDYYDQIDVEILPNTINFSKFIQKYLRLRLSAEFWDKFKYDLIVSNLLDSSMILSKNEQALQSILSHQENFMMNSSTFYKCFSDDGVRLVVTKNYTLHLPKSFYFRNYVLNLVLLIIYLLKQRQMNKLNLDTQTRMFKIILIIATKIIKFKRIYTVIQMNKILNQLNEFLISNFKINKRIILNLITLKNRKLFNNTPDIDPCLNHLSESLNFLIFNLKSSIIKLLPILNGLILEKYCGINKINIDTDDLVTTSDDKIDQIVSKINIFNEYRKFLVCQLLTMEKGTESSFFLWKVADKFDLHDRQFEMNELNNLSTYEKLLYMEELFTDHNKVLSSFYLMFEKFEKLSKLKIEQGVNENEDILKINSNQQHENVNSNLNQLITKLSNLTTNLKFFDKYNQATIDNQSELSEKLTILNQFNTDIISINELYRLNLQEFNYQVNSLETDELVSNSSTSNRNSRTSGEFNLKSFHTRNKRKGSLPNNSARLSPQIPQRSPNTEDDESSRLSAGLKLGLLTVFEDQKASRYPNPGKPRKMDEALSGFEYNQAALDSLSKRKTSRFSINSLNSNVSGLSDIVASTQTTSFDDDDNLLSKEELKLRLEESLNKIYNLENGVDSNRHENDDVGKQIPKDIINEDNVNETTIDKSFLNNLEASLQKGL